MWGGGEKSKDWVFKLPKAPCIAHHIKSMCALFHKLSDDMYLDLDSIKKNNELCKVISDTGKIALQKGTIHGGQPSLAQKPSPISSKPIQQRSTAVVAMSCAKCVK